jgi:hypothetical protein
MRYVITLFDYSRSPPLPLQSIEVADEIRFYNLYLPGTGLKLREIRESLFELKKVFDGPVCVNDFKAHVMAFGLDKHIDYQVYDVNIPKIGFIPSSIMSGKIALAKIVKAVKRRSCGGWNKLVANASVVYQALEDRGVYDGYLRHHLNYSLDTFTGRSKTLGFNLQGTTSEFDIRPTSDRFGYFVHFDWISVDLQMAAYMSGDPEMCRAFSESDPYTVLEESKNHPEFDRSRCKKELLSAIYSLSMNHSILDSFSVFRDWMRERTYQMWDNGYLSSILGRRFYIKGRNELSVFNAQFQGSVVHAMQAALLRIFRDYGEYLFTEIHDSIIMICRQVEIMDLIKGVVEIMNNPLDGYLDNPPNMPVVVSVGKRWKKWKKFKDFRGQR